MDETSKVDKLKESTRNRGLDAVVFLNNYNIQYYSEIHFKHPNTAALLVFPNREPLLYCAEWEYMTALNNGKVRQVRKFSRHDSFFSIVMSALKRAKVEKGRIGIEENYISWKAYQFLAKKLDKCHFIPISEFVANQRAIKTEEEIGKITTASKFADIAMEAAIEAAKEGESERNIAIAAETAMKKAGAEDRAFETIISSGVRTSMCHGFASNKNLEKGELVMLDMGAVYCGYNCDITRMGIVGSINSEQLNFYNSLRAVFKIMLRESQPGARISAIVKKAYTPIQEKGYSQYFTTGFGRGIGLELNERPFLNEKNNDRLVPGMVVVFHPALFLENKFGLRLEGTIQITESGARQLTRTDLDLIQIS